LADILEGVLELIQEYDLPEMVITLLYDQMAKIEQRLAIGCSEKLQSLALISSFIEARELAFDKFNDIATQMECCETLNTLKGSD
jgi:hypothetical protein